MSDSSEKSARQGWKTKVNHEINNPCMTEQQASLKCLDENSYVQDKCEAYFNNYKACMKFWDQVKSDRKRKNIDPLLPPPEERNEVRKEYFGK